MCGACGAGSARSARHWSEPFLASVPARSAAARTLTSWSRSAGWSGTVSAVAGGFQVSTASGRRSLAADLGAVLAQLVASGVPADRLLEGPVDLVEGPPTRPGPRPGHRTSEPVPDHPAGSTAAGHRQWVLPADPRRPYRVPGLLAWLAVAGHTQTLDPLTVHLSLGGADGLLVVSRDGGALVCDAVPAPPCDVVLGRDLGPAADLVALLGARLPAAA